METAAPELEEKTAEPDWRRSRLDPADGGSRTGRWRQLDRGRWRQLDGGRRRQQDRPTETAGPGPTEAAGPGPAETAGRGPTDEAGPGPTETAGPADKGSRTGTGSCCSLSRWCVCVCIRAAESESEPESESVGVGCFSRSRSRNRSRQNLPTPTDSGQALIPDSNKSPCRLIKAFSTHIFVVDWLNGKYRTQPFAALHSRHGNQSKFRTWAHPSPDV